MEEIIALVPLLFVGVDWGSVNHRVIVLDQAGKQLHDWNVEHAGDAITSFIERLVALVDGAAERCHVAIEVKHGPIVEALLERGLIVFAVNPKQTDRFRDRYMPSGAKDDRRDAFVLARALRTDADSLQRLSKTDRRTVVLRALIRLRDELVTDRTRLLLRFREQVWRYYVQLIELADGDFDARWLWALWEKAPTPREGVLLSKPVIARILRDHHVRRLDAPAVMAVLRKPTITVADGVEEAAIKHVRSIVERLRLLDSQIRQANRELEQHLEMWSRMASGPGASNVSTKTTPAEGASSGRDEKPATSDDEPAVPRQDDLAILRSLPGVGTITLATMLAELSEPLHQRDYPALRAFFGVAPITRQSGNSKVVQMRRACSESLRNIAFNWARSAVQHDASCKARFAALRARSKPPAQAYRAVVDHLLRVACSMLRSGALYDSERRASRAALAA